MEWSGGFFAGGAKQQGFRFLGDRGNRVDRGADRVGALGGRPVGDHPGPAADC